MLGTLRTKTVSVPLVDLGPLQSPDAWHVKAFVLSHVNSLVPMKVISAGVTVSVSVGGGTAGGGAGGAAPEMVIGSLVAAMAQPRPTSR